MPISVSPKRTPKGDLPFGLTGGIACGKSTVAGFLRDLGAQVIDADRLVHQLMEPGQSAYQEIIEHFGAQVLGAEGRIDRKILGPLVFADPRKLRTLNAILHPRVIARMYELAGEMRRQDPHSLVVLDVPLIYETGMEISLCKVIVAWCRPEQQLERLMAKTGISPEEAQRRIQAQMPVDEKRRRADYQIDCSGSLAYSRAQTEAIYRELREVVENNQG